MSKYMLLIMSVVLLSLSSCTKKKDNSTGKEKVYRTLLSSNIKTLDPAVSYDAVSNAIIGQIYEPLFQYNYLKRPLTIEPLLAASLPEVSDDGLIYIIKLKSNVKYIDHKDFSGKKGRSVVAKDFVYSFKRMALPKLKSPFLVFFVDSIKGFKKFKDEVVKDNKNINKTLPGFIAVDDFTLKMTLNQPMPHLVHLLSMPFASPLPQDIIEKVGQEKLTREAYGTGPFFISSMTENSKIVLSKNKSYRKEVYPTYSNDQLVAKGLTNAAGKQIPFLDKVVFDIVRESQPGWLKFNKGELDVTGIPKDNFDNVMGAGDTLKGDLIAKGAVVSSNPDPVIWYLFFNMKTKPLGQNIKLRKAISHAINVKTYMKKFLNNRAYQAKGVVPPGFEGYNESNASLIPEFNVEKAKKLLTEAGYPGGKGLPVINYDMRGASSLNRQIAEFIKSSLMKINVNVAIIANSWPKYLEKAKKGTEIQFMVDGWAADFPDAENFLQLLYSKNKSPGPNSANYNNKKFDKLYEKIAYKNLPLEERNQAIKEAEKVALSDVVWSPLVFGKSVSLRYNWVLNYNPNRVISNYLKYIDVDVAARNKALKTLF